MLQTATCDQRFDRPRLGNGPAHIDQRVDWGVTAAVTFMLQLFSLATLAKVSYCVVFVL